MHARYCPAPRPGLLGGTHRKDGNELVCTVSPSCLLDALPSLCGGGACGFRDIGRRAALPTRTFPTCLKGVMSFCGERYLVNQRTTDKSTWLVSGFHCPKCYLRGSANEYILHREGKTLSTAQKRSKNKQANKQKRSQVSRQHKSPHAVPDPPRRKARHHLNAWGCRQLST